MSPEDRWEPWPVEVIQGAGPETVLCDFPPESMPERRPAGFVLPEVKRRRRISRR